MGGHAVWNDFEVLKLSHPPHLIMDTALCTQLRPPWRLNALPSLKLLASYWLEEDLHTGTHDSVHDAITALKLHYLHHYLHIAYCSEFQASMHQLCSECVEVGFAR